MIIADFAAKSRKLCGFKLSGHAGYANAGNDIVCAAVTSAVQLTVNNLTEIFNIDATVTVLENVIECKVSSTNNQTAVKLLEGLKLHLEILSEDYMGTIKVNVLEV
ncbi:MAG: ribosomal-processing cysteine protease Prp [Oscillospiraceae bacterium]